MSHRVKNLLAIASGLTMITSRSVTTAADLARDLTGRLAALGRAHDLVGPPQGGSEKAALLGDLVSVLLAPYDDMGDFQGRIRVSVPRISVGEKSGTTLALVVHELPRRKFPRSRTTSANCGPRIKSVSATIFCAST
jgi:two-component sensor histidine kinase